MLLCVEWFETVGRHAVNRFEASICFVERGLFQLLYCEWDSRWMILWSRAVCCFSPFSICLHLNIMESQNDENLQEFSEPLLKKLRKPNIKATKEKKNKNSNNNNNNNNDVNSNFTQKEKPGLRSNASTYSILPISEVTEAAVEVWAALPEEIRQDPSFKSFRQEHERIHGKFNKLSSILKPRHRKQQRYENRFSLSRRFFQLCLCFTWNKVTALSILITIHLN